MSFLKMTRDNFSNKSILTQYLSVFRSSQEIAARVKAEKPTLVSPLMQKSRSFSFNLAESSIFNTGRPYNKGKLKIILVR